MIRLSILLAIAAASQLWSQDFISVAHRTDTAELLDAATLETVATLHFPFGVERLSPSRDGLGLNVEGYGPDRGCCKHYFLDLKTLTLHELRPSPGPDYYTGCLNSPDSRWCAQTKNFGGPSLRMVDLNSQQPVRELAPSDLPAENSEGNWAAHGAWSADRFFFYVAAPSDSGFLWTVPPAAESLASATRIAPFNVVPACHDRFPVETGIVAAAGNVFLYESFAGKGDRTVVCKASIPGGAWILDPSTGALTTQIAPALHFNRLIAGSGALYGVALYNTPLWSGPITIVKLDAHDGTVLESRVFGPGVLQIGEGILKAPPSGYIAIQ